MTLLSVTDLTKEYQSKKAVKAISFSFEENRCIALLGPNGAGKTTVLRTLAGLLKPTSGTISFKGYKPNEDIRSLIGYLPQYPVFHDWMTGLEFLIYSGQLANMTKHEAYERADELLERVGIADAKKLNIGKYSGGMKQRLGIAQAIIHRPKLLMLDEPVSSLDPIGRREVLTLMEELKKEMTILFSTHILGDAEEVSDELLLLRNGEIIESGRMADLREKYQTAGITLTFHSDLEKYKEELHALPSVRSAYIEREKIIVSADNLEKARLEILQMAIKNHWPLTSFAINRASLEEMFMKVVAE
ncbi:ABC transporter ATP-binding protein [Oceanobacillus piezotolerans]|uniref:ABC transporter ATP-binding protein n=1 Tax=Oceanobacillus piezotolerans TaxID=2448030 RepID=A0A498D212_9BACI|nr:ABC transporter ATP-binding protein [Oceanobacillus piezotolerans]RLL40352.1 ABC transporter ATP-binding protein [Oceanobacillus piezotolerans]